MFSSNSLKFLAEIRQVIVIVFLLLKHLYQWHRYPEIHSIIYTNNKIHSFAPPV